MTLYEGDEVCVEQITVSDFNSNWKNGSIQPRHRSYLLPLLPFDHLTEAIAVRFVLFMTLTENKFRR